MDQEEVLPTYSIQESFTKEHTHISNHIYFIYLHMYTSCYILRMICIRFVSAGLWAFTAFTQVIAPGGREQIRANDVNALVQRRTAKK